MDFSLGATSSGAESCRSVDESLARFAAFANAPTTFAVGGAVLRITSRVIDPAPPTHQNPVTLGCLKQITGEQV
jgi:hypothetical protein